MCIRDSLHRFAPGAAPSWPWVYAVAGTFAAAGFALALFTIRARTVWILLAAVPMVANGSLLLVPLLLHEEVSRVLERADPVQAADKDQSRSE